MQIFSYFTDEETGHEQKSDIPWPLKKVSGRAESQTHQRAFWYLMHVCLYHHAS